MIIRPAVSNGQARPSGLNGSCRLSAPAATLTPAAQQRRDRGQPARHRRAGAAALEEQVGVRGGRPRRCRRRRRARRSRAAAARRLHAEADAVAGRRPGGRTRSSTRSARSPSPSTSGSSVSSVCRSTPTPWSAAICEQDLGGAARAAVASRCGQPPTRSAPAASASRSSARWSAPAAPVTGQPHRATISTSITSATRRRTSTSASTLRRPLSGVVSAWVRTAAKPLAAISRAARSARSTCRRRRVRWRLADHRLDRPSRSPVGLTMRSARNALSRWACGSTAAGQQDVPVEVDDVVARPRRRRRRRR